MKRGPPPSPNRKAHPFVGSLVFQGIPIDIENAKGDVRSGVDKDGHKWATISHAHYGEFRDGVRGEDGDKIDVYVGPDDKSQLVVIVNQNDPVTGKHDEQKCMLGFATVADALALYKRQYDRPKFYGSHVAMTLDRFRSKIVDKKNDGLALAKATSSGKPLTPAQHKQRVDAANHRYHTSSVLGGAYRGKDVGDRELLTHLVRRDENGNPAKVMCGGVKCEHLTDESGFDEGHKEPPTCPKCKEHYDKLVPHGLKLSGSEDHMSLSKAFETFATLLCPQDLSVTSAIAPSSDRLALMSPPDNVPSMAGQDAAFDDAGFDDLLRWQADESADDAANVGSEQTGVPFVSESELLAANGSGVLPAGSIQDEAGEWWAPMETAVAEMMLMFGLAKGLSHKYIKRVPTGAPKGKPQWRYYYKITATAKGVPHAMEHMKVGMSFADGKGGGHWHIVERDPHDTREPGRQIKIRHDETGEEMSFSVHPHAIDPTPVEYKLSNFIQSLHAGGIEAATKTKQAKAKAELAEARTHGTTATVESAKARARKTGIQDRELMTDLEGQAEDARLAGIAAEQHAYKARTEASVTAKRLAKQVRLAMDLKATPEEVERGAGLLKEIEALAAKADSNTMEGYALKDDAQRLRKDWDKTAGKVKPKTEDAGKASELQYVEKTGGKGAGPNPGEIFYDGTTNKHYVALKKKTERLSRRDQEAAEDNGNYNAVAYHTVTARPATDTEARAFDAWKAKRDAAQAFLKANEFKTTNGVQDLLAKPEYAQPGNETGSAKADRKGEKIVVKPADKFGRQWSDAYIDKDGDGGRIELESNHDQYDDYRGNVVYVAPYSDELAQAVRDAGTGHALKLDEAKRNAVEPRPTVDVSGYADTPKPKTVQRAPKDMVEDPIIARTEKRSEPSAKLGYRKTREGDWAVFGPAHALKAGQTHDVHTKAGDVKREHVTHVSRPFDVGGVPHAYGYIRKAGAMVGEAFAAMWKAIVSV